MKLDRNINENGRGKYALVNLRALEVAPHYRSLLDDLHAAGLLTYGNESPGDQFFVMKHKDIFTSHGLKGYAEAVRVKAGQIRAILSENKQDAESMAVSVRREARAEHLEEYAAQIETEAMQASSVEHQFPN